MRANRAVDAAIQLEHWARATGRDVEATREVSEQIVRAQSGEADVDISEELIAKMDIGTEVPEIYAAIGNADKTIAALQDAHKTGVGFRSLLSMRINPSYDFIREDPRFIELLAQIGLAD